MTALTPSETGDAKTSSGSKESKTQELSRVIQQWAGELPLEEEPVRFIMALDDAAATREDP